MQWRRRVPTATEMGKTGKRERKGDTRRECVTHIRDTVDERLLVLIEEGDVEAFDTLYDRHAPFVNGVCCHFLGSQEEAEELLQEIFLGIWEGRLRYRARGAHVKTWLFLIAKNKCIDRLRSSRRRIPHVPVPGDLTSPDGPDPAADAEASERRLRVLSALAELPAEQRRAIETCFFRSTNYREAAQMLGWPLGTLKSRVRLGMSKLASALGVDGELHE